MKGEGWAERCRVRILKEEGISPLSITAINVLHGTLEYAVFWRLIWFIFYFWLHIPNRHVLNCVCVCLCMCVYLDLVSIDWQQLCASWEKFSFLKFISFGYVLSWYGRAESQYYWTSSPCTLTCHNPMMTEQGNISELYLPKSLFLYFILIVYRACNILEWEQKDS